VDFDNFVGILQTVSEGKLETLMTLFLVLIFTGIRTGDMYHTDYWKWKVSTCRVHRLGHFQLSMFLDIIMTLILKIRSGSISDCTCCSTAMMQMNVRWIHNCFSRLTHEVACKITVQQQLEMSTGKRKPTSRRIETFHIVSL